ncbi:MAG: ATP-binding protein, partial [Anaerolineales bacterium]
LVEACAQLADQLLHACANLKIIASSREALGIAGETVYRVPPLSLPDPQHVTREALTQCESAQLFIERASAANPKFGVDERNAEAVAQICRRLDGIPLALELAAARITVFSAEQIAAHLDDRFRLLTGGSRTALPRQQTLRALIDWSYELLSEEERTLLRKLSVFAGGWTFEAAEAVCSELDVLDGLSQLVNKSLVSMEDEEGVPRYGLLETMRQYARDKLLEAGETEPTRNAHFDFFMQLVNRTAPKLRKAGAAQWVMRLDLDYDNIRAALQWGLKSRLEDVLLAIPQFSYFWNRRGYEEEGRQLIREAVNRANELAELEGEAGRQRLNLLGEVWQTLAMLAYSQGDNARAIEASDQAASIARRLDNKRLLAVALGFKASGALFIGDFEDIQSVLDEGMAAAQESGDQFALGLPLAMYTQALVATSGDLDSVAANMETSRKLLKESGDEWGSTMALLSGAMIAKFQGNYAESRKQFLAIEPLFRDLGDQHRINMVRSELAHLERYEGHYQEAEAMYMETIKEWQRIGHRAAVAHQLECLAAIAKINEDGPRAARLFGAAEALRDRINIPMTAQERREYDRNIEDLRSGMDEGVFASNWAEGRAMSMDQAIRFALEKSAVASG